MVKLGNFMRSGHAVFKVVALAVLFWSGMRAVAQTSSASVTGSVLDPACRPVSGALVQFTFAGKASFKADSDENGSFKLALPQWSAYALRAEAAGFAPIVRVVALSPQAHALTLRFERVAAEENVLVVADLSQVSLTSPDPSQTVLVREQLLDANPARPGAPISIPGLPIETASGGIKAPQYFAPGVAGDHGEPIAQYLAVGGYLVTNNLSANAHGNGYADPNIFISAALGGVTTDGGAFNVLEGNHALNLAATYLLRPGLRRFLTLTGDARDADLAGGYAPADAGKREWIALEANYGNGLLKRLEHRAQFKMNAEKIVDVGRSEITLFSLAYWGQSHEGNLVPLGLGALLGDTVDERQQDQTHTAIEAFDDEWTPRAADRIGVSGFFRTYNLALFSNFGEGLIRQSEFRTVEAAEARATHAFPPLAHGARLDAMAGFSYHEDDIHRDNLDHYLSPVPAVYGPFVNVLSSNVKIRDAAPIAALHGDIGSHLRVYAGVRPDAIELKNEGVLNAKNSFNQWSSLVAPKATLAYAPGAAGRWLPTASISIGQGFFTEDPRIAVAQAGGAARPSPFERSHSAQLVVEKAVASTDVRITLGHNTTTQTLGKIDPDNGTQQPLGPGKLSFLTASVRRPIASYGSVQAVFSKADARLLGATIDGVPVAPQITPEAPRTIFDALAIADRLPWGLHARSEYEYVGHKQLDLGNAQHPAAYEAIPVGETRIAMVKPLLDGRLEIGANAMLARGYTGQTTETFAPDWQLGQTPYCAPGSGPSGASTDFDCGAREQRVGIRMVSWVGGSISWRFPDRPR